MSGRMKASLTSNKEVYSFPSYYGSHEKMIDKEMAAKINESGWTVCKDNDGFYATKVSHLDNGIADPYRCSSIEWRKYFLTKKTSKEEEQVV